MALGGEIMAARRMGQVIKRGHRKWLVRVPLGEDAEGRRRFHSKTIEGTKRAAGELEAGR